MIYQVYTIIYDGGPGDGLMAVAVSASSVAAAKARVTGNRPATIIHAELISTHSAALIQEDHRQAQGCAKAFLRGMEIGRWT